MPIWRCPHCGTPQAETARCWVCRRSSTTCSTCRNFRRSVAAQLGYCGLDRRRLPLSGLELRGCWEPGPARSADALPAAATAPDSDEPASPALRLRDFVPVELVRHGHVTVRPRRAAVPPSRALSAVPAALEVSATTVTAALAASDDPRANGTGVLADQVTLFLDVELQR